MYTTKINNYSWLTMPRSSSSEEAGVVSHTTGAGAVAASAGGRKTKATNSSSDGNDSTATEPPHKLKRQLSGRHLNFIAIGGTIGTGFFLGTGNALVKGGPAGCLISFLLVGTVLWSVMVCLGEMATFIPTAGAFSVYASRFVDPSLGFAAGWLYWFSCEYFLSLFGTHWVR